MAMQTMGDLLGELVSTAMAAHAQKLVTAEQVVAKAREMAQRGYVFTQETLKLVRPFLEGEGLLLAGNVGVGKSFFFHCAGIAALNLKVAQGKTLAEISKALDDHQDEPILVDDVGAEEATFKSYGTTIRLLDYILERRSDSAYPTHFTTNLDGDARLARYGERIDDRLFGFAHEYVLTGESRRDPRGAKRKDAWFADFYRGKLWPVCARMCGYYDISERRCTKGKERMPTMSKRPGYDPVPACPYFT